MFAAWITLFLLLPGASSFLIYNTQSSMCLEDTAGTGVVLLKTCDLDSESQQWVWKDRRMLMCVASSRCLSAQNTKPIQTQPCPGSEVNSAGLEWDCDRDRLISKNTSLLLSIAGGHLTLSQNRKQSKWRSLDEGDICQEKLRSRRASDDSDEFAAEDEMKKMAAMTEEQRQFLSWYYRTEDPTPWKFALLALSFVCLLVGFLLLGMGCMANKNRKKIAKYKVAAALAQKSEAEELQVVLELKEDEEERSNVETRNPALAETPLQEAKTTPSNGEVTELKAGDIVVTWKDGNTSSLYPEPAAEEVLEVEKETESVEEKQEEDTPAELEAPKGDNTTE